MSSMTRPTSRVKPSSKRRKPERRARLSADRCDLHLFSDNKVAGSYWLTPIPCEFPGCAAYRLEKFPEDCKTGEPTAYAVCLDQAGEHTTCECKGFLRWGHCKHVESLTALRAAGRIS